MHSFFVGLLTVLMVVDCLILILLVLLQLPKKEAGAGVAFGGAATDALFGAGSGNVLTKITKYVATAFFVMAVALTWMGNPAKKAGTSGLREQLTKSSAAAPAASSTDKLLKTAPQASNPAVETPVAAPTTNK